MNLIGKGIRKFFALNHHLQEAYFAWEDRMSLKEYERSERRPWRNGYYQFRNRYLKKVLNDVESIQRFASNQPLPPNYSHRLDSRLVEIPWALSRLNSKHRKILDAGSSLNSEFVLTSHCLKERLITILTLAPETECHWRQGVSYVFGDLRGIDFKSDLFDAVVCISTIEHVGMDNSMYASGKETAVRSHSEDFLDAIREFRRVLKPDGSLFITFPFGKYEDHGWLQQFDSLMVDKLINAFGPSKRGETIYKYESNGWIISDREACKSCEFFDVHRSKYFDSQSDVEYPADFPAAERAVICLELRKE